MQTHARQTGLTFISLLLLLMMLGFFALLALRLGPVYLENYTIRSVLQGIKQQPGLDEQSPQAIRAMIAKRLYVNEVRRFDNQQGREYLTIKRHDNYLTVSIDYEVRQHILGNVDAMVSFSDSVELPTR
jgi:hypothetical protein